MPIYHLECGACAHSFERYHQRFSDPNAACEKCGGATERVWQDIQRGATQIFPYTTTHLTGEPIEIRSAKHLRQLEKQHGVQLRDDVAYTEKRYVGYDWRTRKQVYREGAGVGSPGCWV